MEWLLFFATSLHISFIRLFRPNYFVTGKENYNLVQSNANQEIAKNFSLLDKLLGERDYLNNGEVQICDISLFNYGRWGNLAEKPTKDYPNLARFMEKIALIPSVKKILSKEGIGLYRDQLPQIL